MNFSDELYEILKRKGIKTDILSDAMFYDPFDDEFDFLCDVTKYGNPPINFNEVGLPSHYWIYYNGKHYDSDCPEGVKDLFKISIIKNFYKKV